MCQAIVYAYENRQIKTYFASHQASLPVLKKDSSFTQGIWGRRIAEAGKLPLGGWASLDSIEAGRWDAYFPKAVKIPAQRFMEKNIEGNSHWFTVVKGQYLQGLLAQYDREQRLYIVTIKLENTQAVYTRWPRIVLGK